MIIDKNAVYRCFYNCVGTVEEWVAGAGGDDARDAINQIIGMRDMTGELLEHLSAIQDEESNNE